jgi:threonine dehydrogenase-like Zn-dependent dehydrogenase
MTMWAYRLDGPLTFSRHDIPEPRMDDVPDGSVVLRFRAGGVCGSDIARCLDGGSAARPGSYGLSLHEIVGDVVATRSDLPVGERVVGWVGRSLGLKELIVTEAEALAPVPPHMDDVEAAPHQPLACVLHAMTRLGDLTGMKAAVIGLGPIGLLYGHALKDRGVAHVTGIDLVDRSALAADFGFDETETVIGRAWSSANKDRFDLVVEAVGHQVGTMQNAIDVVAPGGTIVYFGNPDDRHYPIDFGQMMDKDVILHAGRTPQKVRRQAMLRSMAYTERYPGMMKSYVTHVLPLERMQEAYELAARPAVGRVKVVLSG